MPDRALIAVAPLVTAALLAGCGGDRGVADTDADTERPTVVVGIIPWPGSAPIYVAQQRGLCAQDRIELSVRVTDDPAVIAAELESGEIDVADFVNNTLVQSAAAGIPLRAFLALDYSVGADGVVAAHDVTVEEIARRGLRFGADRGNTGYFLLMLEARRRGLAPGDFRHVQMLDSAAAAAFRAGRIDAAGLYEPFLSEALRRPGSSTVVTSESEPGAISDVWAALATTLEERHDEMVAFARCWYRAIEFARNRPDEALSDMAELLRTEPSTVAEQLEKIEWPDRADGGRYLRGGALEQLLRFSAELYRAVGLIQGDINIEELVDPSVADRLAE